MFCARVVRSFLAVRRGALCSLLLAVVVVGGGGGPPPAERARRVVVVGGSAKKYSAVVSSINLRRACMKRCYVLCGWWFVRHRSAPGRHTRLSPSSAQVLVETFIFITATWSLLHIYVDRTLMRILILFLLLQIIPIVPLLGS